MSPNPFFHRAAAQGDDGRRSRSCGRNPYRSRRMVFAALAVRPRSRNRLLGSHDAARHDAAQSAAVVTAKGRVADPGHGVARDYFRNTVDSNVLSVTTPPKTDNVAPTAPTNLRRYCDHTQK
jgi:hypothetical protein